MTEQWAVLAALIFIYSVVAGRVQRSMLSGPIIFVCLGYLLGPMALGWFSGDNSRQDLRLLADFTLTLCLFTDAANADLSTLKRRFGLPTRMLLLGLPGAIVLGFLAALLIFEQLTLFEAAILGTMLAATDAALGTPVITNPRVPARLREGLKIESGLNDGLCVPILLAFIALETGAEEGLGGGLVLKLLAEEIGIGVLAGAGIAALGTLLLRSSQRLGWLTHSWGQVMAVALAVACYATAQSLHGSGYIAAFTGGLVFGALARGDTADRVLTAEEIGETLALLTWFLFGCAVIGQVFGQFTWPMLVYALLSLTVVRMLPVLLALAGSGETARNRLFLGWFGPRGLASIVFAVIVLDHRLEHAEFIALVVSCIVFVSLVLHGISANPLVNWIERNDRPPAD